MTRRNPHFNNPQPIPPKSTIWCHLLSGLTSAPLFSEAFRAFFLCLSLYAVLSMGLWGLVWAGRIDLNLSGNVLLWHIYEMLYGIGMAGMIGFLLTALPSFTQTKRLMTANQLLFFLLWWVSARVSFWLLPWSGIWLTALLQLGLTVSVMLIVIKPIWRQTGKPHLGLGLAFLLLAGIQLSFFISQLFTDWPQRFETMRLLSVSISAFMILVVLVLRRVMMGVTNDIFTKSSIDEPFIARPPRYHLAVLTLTIYLIAELCLPTSSALGWLGIAVAFSLLNLGNDVFILSAKAQWAVLRWQHSRYLWLLVLMMAAGYAMLGWDYLSTGAAHLAQLRHILTSGVMGMAYILILSIVSVRHTGRLLKSSVVLDLMMGCVIIATLLRVVVIIYPSHISAIYTYAAFIWAAAFIIYLACFGPYLIKPNQKEPNRS